MWYNLSNLDHTGKGSGLYFIAVAPMDLKFCPSIAG